MQDLRLDTKPFARGGGGQVYRGRYMANAIAAKKIWARSGRCNKSNHEQEQNSDHMRTAREAAFLASLHHPNILAFYGIARDHHSGQEYKNSDDKVGDILPLHPIEVIGSTAPNDSDDIAVLTQRLSAHTDTSRTSLDTAPGSVDSSNSALNSLTNIETYVEKKDTSAALSAQEETSTLPKEYAFYLVFEWCGGGDLSTYLASSAFGIAELSRVALEILSGVVEIHANGIAQ